jgi:flagellin-like protein
MMKNSKAISPIFATLILIAIAVIAGVVVYMFTSGTLATMTNGGTAGQEKVSVQGASGTTTGVTVYVEQTSGPAASVNGLIIKDQSGSTVASATVTGGPVALTSGVLTTIKGTLASLAPGTYTVTVTTAAGGSFVSPQFVVS